MRHNELRRRNRNDAKPEGELLELDSAPAALSGVETHAHQGGSEGDREKQNDRLRCPEHGGEGQNAEGEDDRIEGSAGEREYGAERGRAGCAGERARAPVMPAPAPGVVPHTLVQLSLVADRCGPSAPLPTGKYLCISAAKSFRPRSLSRS